MPEAARERSAGFQGASRHARVSGGAIRGYSTWGRGHGLNRRGASVGLRGRQAAAASSAGSCPVSPKAPTPGLIWVQLSQQTQAPRATEVGVRGRPAEGLVLGLK